MDNKTQLIDQIIYLPQAPSPYKDPVPSAPPLEDPPYNDPVPSKQPLEEPPFSDPVYPPPKEEV